MDESNIKVIDGLTYAEMMRAAVSKGLRAIDVTIAARTYRTVIVKATLTMRSRVYTSLAEGTWNDGIEAASRRAKAVVLAEALGVNYPVEEARRTEAVDDGKVTAPQIRLIHALCDRLGKSEEERSALNRLSKNAASAMITMLKYEAYRRQA